MSKTVLVIIGIVILVMGLLALFVPGWLGATEPTWHAVAKVVVGLIALYVGSTDKAEK